MTLSNFPRVTVESIEFGILSKEDILDLSVCKIDNKCKTILDNRSEDSGTVYTKELGAIGPKDKPCLTCKLPYPKCPGHFGHIELVSPVINNTFIKYIADYLTIICVECNRLLFDYTDKNVYQQLELRSGYNHSMILQKLVAYVKKSAKNNICVHCNHKKSSIFYSTIPDPSHGYIIYTKTEGGGINIIQDGDILELFSNLIDKDVKFLGCKKIKSTSDEIDRYNFHPRHLIFELLPVLPISSRPPVIIDDKIRNDQLTDCYRLVVELNQKIRDLEGVTDENRKKVRGSSNKQVLVKQLRRYIHTMLNMDSGRFDIPAVKNLKSIKIKLKGKNGILRKNIMGKRVNQSARTVIDPDPTIAIDEVAIPRFISRILIVPEKVTYYNRDRLQKLLDNNQVKSFTKTEGNRDIIISTRGYYAQCKSSITPFAPRMDGDVLINRIKDLNDDEYDEEDEDKFYLNDVILRDGSEYTITYDDLINPDNKYSLEMGNVVNRYLMDGDVVFLNRQPSLHKYSMLAMKAVIKDTETFGINMAYTKIFNADCDGDEMNIHCPTDIQSRIELMELATPVQTLISTQSGGLNYMIVQDSMLTVYLMTKDITEISEQCVDKLLSACRYSTDYINQKKKDIKMVYPKYNGKALFSFLLPPHYSFTHTSTLQNTGEKNRVVIDNGVLLEGIICKNNLVMLKHMIFNYDRQYAIDFLNNVQWLCKEWISIRGFSIGIKDCTPTSLLDKDDYSIKSNVNKAFKLGLQLLNIKASNIIGECDIRAAIELQLNYILNNVRNEDATIAKNNMDPETNSFMSMVTSGSKGSMANIVQVMGILAQQNVGSERVVTGIGYGDRQLYCYPHDLEEKVKSPDCSDEDIDMYYESHGFVNSSFLGGLNPKEFFCHAMSSRVGMCDKTVSTANTGYVQRRLVKILEDNVIRYDNTVRNGNDKIIQYYYGESGLQYPEEDLFNVQELLKSIE